MDDRVKPGQVRKDSLGRFKVLRPYAAGLLTPAGWIVANVRNGAESFASDDWVRASPLIQRVRSRRRRSSQKGGSDHAD